MCLTHVSRPGNDPLIDEESNHDINSVAGVLKLYFRGLENPLFPKDRFNDLISCVREYHALFTGSVKEWTCSLLLKLFSKSEHSNPTD